jgi:uncharacterized membrane protein YphA (DoxX/SURF4 family)
MALSAKLRRAPMRIVTGAYILNSGVSKFQADDETAKRLHGTAVGTYDFLGNIDPKTFSRALAAGEVTVGALVLAPMVPPVIAGAALMGFSGLLLNMWWNTPGMHEEGSPRPTPQGSGIAKDVWMFGIGTGLVMDGLLEPAHDKRLELTAAVTEKAGQKRKQAKEVRKAAKSAAKEARREALASAKQNAAAAKERKAKMSRRARKAADEAGKADALKRAQAASAVAAERLASMRDEYGPVAAEKARIARERAKELADEYGPVAAEKARIARERAKELADEYGPVAAEKARIARERAKALADEYGPVAAEKAKQAQEAAREAAERARAAVRS